MVISRTASSTPRGLILLAAIAMLATALSASASQVAAEEGPHPVNVGVAKAALDSDGLPISSVNAGESFRYRIVFFNNGFEAAEGVVVSDDLDDSLVVESTFFDVDTGTAGGTGTCDVAAGNVITCNVGTVGPKNGTSDSGFVRIVVTTAADVCGPITNQAMVSATNESEGKDVDNHSAVVSVDVVGCEEATPTPTPEQPIQPGTPTPEGSVQGGNPTPEPSQPDTAMSSVDSSAPIAPMAFGLIFLVAFATLLTANVKAARRSR
jgi:uncharacterized repeat protein (TIGR01451 family)